MLPRVYKHYPGLRCEQDRHCQPRSWPKADIANQSQHFSQQSLVGVLLLQGVQQPPSQTALAQATNPHLCKWATRLLRKGVTRVTQEARGAGSRDPAGDSCVGVQAPECAVHERCRGDEEVGDGATPPTLSPASSLLLTLGRPGKLSPLERERPRAWPSS